MDDNKDFEPIVISEDSSEEGEKFLYELGKKIYEAMGFSDELIAEASSAFCRHMQEMNERYTRSMDEKMDLLFHRCRIQNNTIVAHVSTSDHLYNDIRDVIMFPGFSGSSAEIMSTHRPLLPIPIIELPTIDVKSIQDTFIPETVYSKEYVSNVIDALKTPREDCIATLPYIPQEAEKVVPNFDFFIKNKHKCSVKKKKKKGKK